MSKGSVTTILALVCVSVITFTSCGTLSAGWDAGTLAASAAYAATGLTLSNEQVAQLSAQSVAEMDAAATIDKGAYQQRLDRLLSKIKSVGGITFNYKVYKTKEINAFACGDGSIRVYSGLMDVMDDDELMAIIGHEIGHVVHQDTRKAMKNAYLSAAARGVISASNSAVGALSSSVLGDIAESFVSSQYSQKQEYQADEYGFQFAVQTGHSPYSMYKSLNKLVNLAGGSQASLVQKMFSSHPDSASRAAKMKEKADAYKTSK